MMVGEVAAQKALLEETIATVVERTGGVPLFVEEMTRAVLESGNAKLTQGEIPATLHDSLMARLDRLGPAKEMLQIAAVIGGEFSYELLHAVYPSADEDLQRALRIGIDAELISLRGIAPDASYQFKHALIRDVAYDALLKSRRKDLHRMVARTIDEKFPVLKEAQPEVLARHWTQAGETEAAIAGWSKAGAAAEARHAFSEALESYQQALALLNLLPESPRRDRRELELRHSVRGMLWSTRGFATPETSDAIDRATALAEKSGNLTQLLNLTLAKGVNAMNAGNLPAAGALADEALELALREGNPVIVGVAHTFQVMARHFRADLDGAEKHYTAGLKFFENPGFKLTREPRLSAFAYSSWNAWMLGRADLARERMARMIVNGNNPYDLALSGYYLVYLRVYMREYEQAEALAERTLELSDKNQFQQFAAISRCVLGHARAQVGGAGVELIRQGIADLLKAGAHRDIGYCTGFLAQAQAREGAIIEALETIEQALWANPDEPVHRPEIIRVRGGLRFSHGQTELAEADFREAIALAQKIGAKAWELRATISLARLLAKEGRRDEARATLAEIYGWFTEGFDTRDLKDAKSLLGELTV
jgi:tetratricopeptide (TPR) repeat protein